ncbi:MAG: hypothetical protein M3N30_05435 [Bacteroidota bacterium]|nr:hypothetical protein [Bacteroidota bacterium]
MKLISFRDASAQRVYNNYIQRCKKAVSILPDKDQEECLLEINSHIYEFLADHPSENEMKELLDVLDRLGPPEETLKNIVAAKKIEQATRTFNPKHLLQALVLNISNGIIYFILLVLYLLLLCFPILGILKFIRPGHVGYFISDNGRFWFGYVATVEHSKELLGYWFIPIIMVATGIIYIAIILILAILRKIKAKHRHNGVQFDL